tara:strand:- start:333 stop:548 length:216 start_codon:yes stop_codon:yes gene_type:complete
MKVEVIQYTIKATEEHFYKLRYTIKGFDAFVGDRQFYDVTEALDMGERMALGPEISEKVIATFAHSKEDNK